MQKVITINLNGNGYQIDESGHAALVAYLDGAERLLKDNPDRAGASASNASAAGGRPRRLYLIHEGAMFAGVCTGLAAYLHVDVTIVRIVFLFLALVTRGASASPICCSRS
jgi:hypothetical protein